MPRIGADGLVEAGCCAGEKISFELGCSTHWSYATWGRGKVVRKANCHLARASVARPSDGEQTEVAICPTCGKPVRVRVASRKLVMCRRVVRILAAAALIAYIAVAWSGPTGEISTVHALQLTLAFWAVSVSLFLLARGFFGSEVSPALRMVEDPGEHALFEAKQGA